MRLVIITLAATLLAGCVSQQLKHASVTDFDQAIAMTQNPDFPNPVLGECLQKWEAFVKGSCTTGCGIASTIAEVEAARIIDQYPACIITKAKIQAWFAKFGIVVPVTP